MPIAAILALLQAVPSIFAAAQSIRATLSTNDQATLDAALAAAQAAAMTDIAKAETDLTDAAKS
jgi:hypothetical protein